MRKILVIGDGNSVFVKDFIAQYLAQGVVVDLLSPVQAPPVAGVRRHMACHLQGWQTQHKITQHLALYCQLRKRLAQCDQDYDSTILHFISIIWLPHVAALVRTSKNFVAVVWGSDLYRSGKLVNALKRRIYQAAQHIIFTNPKAAQYFSAHYPGIATTKLQLARFGLPALAEIQKIRADGRTRQQLCQPFGLPADKLLIMVGYSASLAHRQVLFIEQFSALPADIRQTAHLVFPLSYGDSSAQATIRQCLLQNNIRNFSVLTQFYNFEQIAQLRCVSDILINIQVSDQFSGSMQETLYAGGRVITGAWLPYQDFSSLSPQIILIPSPEDVGAALAEALKTPPSAQEQTTPALHNYIENASSWSKTIADWDRAIWSQTPKGAV